MKNPKQRETTDRKEMMCPRCQTEGLESHPAYEDEYEGNVELLKATRCPNENCEFHKGVPRDKIEMQMPESGIMDLFNLPSDVSGKDVLTVVAIIGVAVLMAASYGIGPFGESTDDTPATEVESQIQGTVQPFQGEYPEVLLYQSGNLIDSTTATENGTYTISADELKTGKYQVYLNYSEHANPPGQTIEINEESTDKNLNFTSLPQEMDININQSAGRSEFSLNYKNPKNIQNLNLGITPIEGESVERTKDLSTERTQNVLMPVFPASQEYRVEAGYTYENFNTTGSYQGQPESYEVRGNVQAERLRVVLPESTASDAITRDVTVPDGGRTEEISVASEETLGPVEVTLKNGTTSQTEQKSGVWDNQQNITLQTGADEFVSGTLQIEPETVSNEQSIQGSIRGSQINHNFQGNVPVEDAVIQFNGGDIQAALEGSASLDLNAENGSTGTVTKEIATISEDGSYSLDWDPEFTQNQDLVNFFYEVNGERTDIDSDDSRTLSLSQGDTVTVGGSAELQTMVDDSQPPSFANSLDSDLEVTNIEFSDDNPGQGEPITVSVTVKNTGSSQVSDTVELYQNKELVGDEDVSLNAGQETTLGLYEFGEPVTSDQPGLEVWHVNQRDPAYLMVSINEKTFGIGNMEAELFDVGTRGTVNVDTDGDGNLDCEADARGGECEFGAIEPGNTDINVEESGVSGTSYTLEYTSKENPRGITIDVGNDGLTDLEYDGVLNEAISEPIELPPGEAKINVSVDNQIPFSYGVVWESSAVIDNPVVYVDGDAVIKNQGTFVQSRTFEIDPLSEGSHNIRFQSQNGGYEAEIKWREEESKAFPEAIIDNQRACAPADFANNLTCVVTDVGVSPGQHTLDFRQAPNEVFNYRIEQDARAVASDITINVGGQTSETFSRPSLEPEPWESVSTTGDFARGENTVDVVIQEENGIVPDANVGLRYLLDSATVENIEITVINDNGTENTVQLPRDGQSTIQKTDIELSKDWFTVGNNTVRLNPTPVDGVFEVNGRVLIHEEEDFTFRTIG